MMENLFRLLFINPVLVCKPRNAREATKLVNFSGPFSLCCKIFMAVFTNKNRERFSFFGLPGGISGVPRPFNGTLLFTKSLFGAAVRRLKYISAIFTGAVFYFSMPLPVKSGMFTPCHYFKILNSVIRLILVHMVNKLVGVKISSKMFRHYISMLVDLPSSAKHWVLRHVNNYISVFINCATALPIVVFMSLFKCHLYSPVSFKVNSLGRYTGKARAI